MKVFKTYADNGPVGIHRENGITVTRKVSQYLPVMTSSEVFDMSWCRLYRCHWSVTVTLSRFQDIRRTHM